MSGCVCSFVAKFTLAYSRIGILTLNLHIDRFHIEAKLLTWDGSRINYVMRAPYKERKASRLNGIPLRVSDGNVVGLWCACESHLALLTFNCCQCAQCAASERDNQVAAERHKFPAGHIREKAIAFSEVWLRMHLSVCLYCALDA